MGSLNQYKASDVLMTPAVLVAAYGLNPAAALATAETASSESPGYIGNDTTCEHTRSAIGHMAGLVDLSAGCRGIGTG